MNSKHNFQQGSTDYYIRIDVGCWGEVEHLKLIMLIMAKVENDDVDDDAYKMITRFKEFPLINKVVVTRALQKSN